VRVRTASASAHGYGSRGRECPETVHQTMDGKGEPGPAAQRRLELDFSRHSPARSGEYLDLVPERSGRGVSPTIPRGQAGRRQRDISRSTEPSPRAAVTYPLGDKQAAILFAGLAPRLVGLYRINLRCQPICFGGTPFADKDKGWLLQSGVQAPIDGRSGPAIDWFDRCVPSVAGAATLDKSP